MIKLYNRSSLFMSILHLLVLMATTGPLQAMEGKRKREEQKNEKGLLIQPANKKIKIDQGVVPSLKTFAKPVVVKKIVKLLHQGKDINELISQIPSDLIQDILYTPFQNSLLHEVRNPQHIRTLLLAGVNPNATNYDNQTVFNYYLNQNRWSAARLLLKLEQDAEFKKQFYDKFRKPLVIDTFTPDKFDTTPLMNAIKIGDLPLATAILKRQIKRGPLLPEFAPLQFENAMNKAGQTALNLAIELAPQLVAPIIANNIDLALGYPLHVAISSNNTEAIRLLLDKDPTLINQVRNINTPLMKAVSKKNIAAIDILLQYNPDLYFESESGQSVATLAINSGNTDIVDKLIHAGYSIDTLDQDDYTMIRYAASNGKVKMLKFLLKRGANPNITAVDVPTPLMELIIDFDILRRKKSILALLEDEKTNISKDPEEEITPLSKFLSLLEDSNDEDSNNAEDDKKIVKAFIQRKTPVSQTDLDTTKDRYPEFYKLLFDYVNKSGIQLSED